MSVNIQEHVDRFEGPTGRRYKLEKHDGNPQYLEITYADGKSGDLPENLKNHLFTKKDWGERYLKEWLRECWADAMSRTKVKNA
ncbi:MAG: hypothetical protein E6Q97_19580 [Desulfurellales bacterium]|nr:MAG: hypothetical protein E6Q97_19580 [Desulfurellales bacterium]